MATKKLTKEIFVERSKSIYGDRYDYSESIFKTSKHTVNILCSLHGEFTVNANEHMRGRLGCSKCVLYDRKMNFIEKSHIIHNNKYDYSKVDYVKNSKKVIIICPEHGEFLITPAKHKDKKQGCPICSNKIRNTKDFIRKAKEAHGDKYDYSKSKYVNSTTKIDIICPEHGIFKQVAGSHYSGNGCSKCSGLYNYTIKEWVKLAKSIHGDTYDYSKGEYINNRTHITIICKIHGEFEQMPIIHTTQKCGCQKCANERCGPKRITVEEFKTKSNEIHNNKFDYSLVNEFKNSRCTVNIICPRCGLFQQTVTAHLNGNGCNKCRHKNTEDFINEAIEVHGNIYSYERVNYIDFKTPVKIMCKKHGEFLQKPKHHVGEKSGCPKCKLSKGEEAIMLWLDNNSIKYYSEYRFDDCKDKGTLPFDFYLPTYDVCIEYDGIQHFKPTYFGKMKSKSKKICEEIKQKRFIDTQRRDKIKDEYCKKHNIRLIRIPYTEFDNIESILLREFN